MRFASSQMFWLLLIIVPPLIAFYWWAWKKRQQLITQFISPRLLGHLKVGVSPSRQKARMAMIVLTVILAIFALARFQWGVTREEARLSGLDIIVAIDTSKSMLAEDVPPNRLTRAKLAALDLMHRAKTDRLGLIAFAGDAFLVCPLTLDDAAFSQSVNALDTQTISQGGTAIEQAIEEAHKAFKAESDNHKVLVLITDGEDHEGDAVSAAEAAAKDGMVIFTVGVGTPEGEQIRVKDEHGRFVSITDEDGKPVISKLNEELLQQIARTTKGFYLPLRGTKTMDTIYDLGIAPLPKSEKSVRTFQHFNEWFQLFLIPAILLLILETFLPDRKIRSSKHKGTSVPTQATALAETVSLLLLLLALPLAARASPTSALREYNAGDYQGALRDYNQLLESKKDDPRLHFNAGTAAYQSRQLDDAAREFNSALASPDLQLQQRAYYNLGNTLYRAGEEITDTSKKQEAWENALKNYENALKLNQQDGDAKFNDEYVKRQLEELKKQQSQSQKSDKNQKQDQKNQDQNKSPENQQNQDQKNQSSQNQQDQKDQQSQAQNKQDQNQSKQEQNQAREKSDEEKKQEQQQQQAEQQKSEQQKKEDAQKQAAQQASAQPQDKNSEEARREAAMMAAGEMTPKQAEQLLDSQKDDDKVFQLAPPNKNTSQLRSFKDW